MHGTVKRAINRLENGKTDVALRIIGEHLAEIEREGKKPLSFAKGLNDFYELLEGARADIREGKKEDALNKLRLAKNVYLEHILANFEYISKLTKEEE